MLQNVIRTAVISALGAKLAKGRSPIVAALLMLLATRALAGSENKASDPSPATPGSGGGLGSLIESFRKGGFEDIIKSWIGTGPNKQISPNQVQQALGPETIDDLSRESGMPKEDLLTQLSRLLPDVVDKLSPNGKLPSESELLAGPGDAPTKDTGNFSVELERNKS
jgi:uncharacterized protein YidB (DUF937 family)